MLFCTPNNQRSRFALIDSGCMIVRETKEKITWAGEKPPRSMNIEVLPA